MKLILRLFIRRRQWRQIEALLEAGLAEHEHLGDSRLDLD
jgi:hypothetical protein